MTIKNAADARKDVIKQTSVRVNTAIVDAINSQALNTVVSVSPDLDSTVVDTIVKRLAEKEFFAEVVTDRGDHGSSRFIRIDWSKPYSELKRLKDERDSAEMLAFLFTATLVLIAIAAIIYHFVAG